MMLWVAFAFLTALAAVTIVWPLARARDRAAAAEPDDVAVYREQLHALDGEVERGVMTLDEAEAARLEISRRLLAAAERLEADGGRKAWTMPAGMVASLLVAVVSIGSLAAYLRLGAPDLPGQPLAARLAAPVEGRDVQTLVAGVETHLAANPDDGQGWEVVAPVYMRLGRFDDAANAYANTIRILGETPDRLGDLGEALTQANGGIVANDARTAFARANELDATLPRPRFFLALALEQDGKRDEAIEAWRALLDMSSADAPWRAIVEERLAGLGGASVAPGPSAADVEAAQDLEPGRRAEMIDQMVARLAARLAENGSDLEGWLRLARAYMVLGKPDDARAALASAQENFGDDEGAMSKIKAFASELGIEG